MEPNDVNEAPTEEVEAQPAEQAEVQETEQEAQDTSQDVAASTEEEATEPSQVTETPSPEEIDWTQYVPETNAQIPTDESGQVDPQAFRQQLKQELRFESQEVSSWKSLERDHPEIRTDAGLREMILAKRIFDVQQGRKGTLEAAAEDVFSRLSGAKNEGKAAQAASITVQKSAALQKPSGTKGTSTTPDLRARVQAGDQQAMHQMLMGWVENGKIEN